MTAPDTPLVDVIRMAMTSHGINPVRGRNEDGDLYVCSACLCGHSYTYDHVARAVLAALEAVGTIEWALFRKTDPVDADAEPVEEYKFASAEEAMHWAIGDYIPSFAATVEPRSRLTFPWTAVEG